MTKKMPQNIKDSFYFEFCKPSNYKDLSIKKNAINNKLENIYNNNIWNLKSNQNNYLKK